MANRLPKQNLFEYHFPRNSPPLDYIYVIPDEVPLNHVICVCH